MSSATARSHYRVFGGPLDRTIASVPKGTARYSEIEPFGRPQDQFWYVLVEALGGGKAFVPERDADLLTAFSSSSRDFGDPRLETLAAETQRRGLEI